MRTISDRPMVNHEKKSQIITTYQDIDWSQLWRNCRAEKSWKSKTSGEWDKKASAFSERNTESPYTDLFLEQLPLTPETTVLDIGCGPGTLAIPIAGKVRQVTAIDYSAGMIEVLRKKAEQKGITNIRSKVCSWDDDWQTEDIGIHDIVIASRSLNIDDLAGAIRKANEYAGRFVYISDRVAPSPFDPDAFAALGRAFRSGPDYIYTMNNIYSLGIHPCLDYIELPSKLVFSDMQQAVQSYAWMFRDLTQEEEARLKHYIQSRQITTEESQVIISRRHPQKWAVISWKKRQPDI